MTLEWRGRTLVITWLPVASMGRLAACAPQTAAETEVLAALLAALLVHLGYHLCRDAGLGTVWAVAGGIAAGLGVYWCAMAAQGVRPLWVIRSP